MKQQLVIGLVAHVDAGKTTLTEGMLYTAGCLKRLGRVDHGDAFLDTDALERERGITIFSKQARLPLSKRELILLDTPGHVDFSAEMERTLQVLDCAILVISGAEGVQSHTETLWRLLKRHQIPTFLFVNKMDLPGADRTLRLEELRARLDSRCVDFGLEKEALWEEAALCDEALMERYLEAGVLTQEELAHAAACRRLFPCCFGSALHLEGIERLLQVLETYTEVPVYPAGFGAKVYKISRDSQGNRLTWLKVTGGELRPRTRLTNRGTLGPNGRPVPEEEVWEEKADQLRLYSGVKFIPTDRVAAGGVCAVTGLTKTWPGQALGQEAPSTAPMLEPVLTYRVGLPKGYDVHTALRQLRELEEEDPQLHVLWRAQLREIHLQLMGEIQLEVLRRLVLERFGFEITFQSGSIIYKETLAAPVEGAGHFEPLRHYAEVHLLLEPGEPGSGVVLDTICSEDVLDRNWQRLILTHLGEREHPGVLTGSPLTDVKLTLVTGRAHPKHTEGGDFRQATYRAVRQGLRRGKSILLEPWYHFRLEVPAGNLGRAMADVQQMHGSFEAPEQLGERAVLTGTAPVATMRDYLTQVNAYTKGRGRLTCAVQGYAPCHNQEEVVAAIGYQPDADVDNSADSVFCAHGAGFVVKWDEVERYMHLQTGLKLGQEESDRPISPRPAAKTGPASDKELERIFERTYGPVKRRDFRPQSEVRREERRAVLPDRKATPDPREEYLLVDGYNMIFAWEDLKALARKDLDAARQALMDTLCNYQGYKGCHVILVFDAYKVRGGVRSVERYHNIHVVYTKEAETADMYIEKVTYEIGRRHRVRVATSDGLEQVIILGHGSLRVSAQMLQQEVAQASAAIARNLERHNQPFQTTARVTERKGKQTAHN